MVRAPNLPARVFSLTLSSMTSDLASTDRTSCPALSKKTKTAGWPYRGKASSWSRTDGQPGCPAAEDEGVGDGVPGIPRYRTPAGRPAAAVQRRAARGGARRGIGRDLEPPVAPQR